MNQEQWKIKYEKYDNFPQNLIVNFPRKDKNRRMMNKGRKKGITIIFTEWVIITRVLITLIYIQD